MSEGLIVAGTIVFFALTLFSILWFVRRAFVRHDPERATASVLVEANTAFELQLPGRPGALFFRFDLNGVTDGYQDLLVSGEIFDEHGGTRSFAVKTSQQSKIPGAGSARYARTGYAVTTSKASISLADVRAGDRTVRGVVSEHPSGLLRKGSIYVPGRA